jgi:hypothetical protein
MKIRITKTIKLDTKLLNNVMDELMLIQGPMEFIEEKSNLIYHKDNFEWKDFFEKCTEYREKNKFHEEDFLVVLTELRNESNWFSVFSSNGERTLFINSSDWENYIYSEPQIPISYEVIANILQLTAHLKLGNEFINYIHNEPVGCMNDMCSWKPDITFKLRTGDICPECLNMLNSILQKDVIEQSINYFESFRKKMLHNKAWQKPMSFEEKLPFSVAITKRKMASTLEPFRKMLMLIDHFDSIVRTAVLMLAGLTKTRDEMEVYLVERRLYPLTSLGRWVEALVPLAKTYSNRFPEFQLPRDFSIKVRMVVKLADDNKIAFIRNEKRGHGYIECNDGSYKEIFSQCIIVLEQIENLLSPLFYRFNYFNIISLKKLKLNSFKVLIRSLSGSNSSFMEREIITEFNKIEDVPIEGDFYLVTPDLKQWINLSPYFSYEECLECNKLRFLIYDGQYKLDPYIGHRFHE